MKRSLPLDENPFNRPCHFPVPSPIQFTGFQVSKIGSIYRDIFIAGLWKNCLLILFVLLAGTGHAQPEGKCFFKDNKFQVEIDKKMSPATLKAFIVQYDLAELALPMVISTNNTDTLKKLGWDIKLNAGNKLVITKGLEGSTNLSKPGHAIDASMSQPSFKAIFPAVTNKVIFGYNRFKNKYPFAENGAVTRFFLRGYKNAQVVTLAGSFNNWDPKTLKMSRTDSGWIADVRLQPGKYWYKFVHDGNWVFDTDNYTNENDGKGNINSVFFKTNTVLKLNGFTSEKRAFVAGSFNGWRRNELAMQRTANGWVLPIYLADGSHTYKFVTNGKWLEDVTNKDRLPDGEGGYNSVIRLGKPHLFSLKGYANASKVVLAGSFNGWRQDELLMKKTAGGWELPYHIGPGNYEYKFIVDGKWISDPANPLTVGNENGSRNSYLIIGANYTFRLKGKPGASKVFLAGDFNNWAPDALAMRREGNDWVYPVYLSPGKHKYKFVVDGNWILDPSNKEWEQNEYGNGNSVVWIEN